MNEFENNHNVSTIVVHDRRVYTVYRRFAKHQIKVSHSITNSGPFSPPPRAENTVPLLTEKPLGLWLALIVDRRERFEEVARDRAAVALEQQAVMGRNASVAARGSHPAAQLSSVQSPRSIQTRSMRRQEGANDHCAHSAEERKTPAKVCS